MGDVLREDMKGMEKHLVTGNLVEASRSLIRLRDAWDEADESEQSGIKRLEAVYLSMIGLLVENRYG